VNGPEVIRRLLSAAPHVKVLFMSGHTSHALLRDGKLQASPNFIQKPFGRAALNGKIREVLDA
jgi:FixJ family two-component response regulator